METLFLNIVWMSSFLNVLKIVLGTLHFFHFGKGNVTWLFSERFETSSNI